MSMWSTTTEEVKRIEMKFLKDSGYLNGIRSTGLSWSCRGEPTGNISIKIDTLDVNPFLRLEYKTRRNGEEWQEINYKVRMSSSPCRYGGKRWWFHCPVSGCGRRCTILYDSFPYFVCRKCAGLIYESQQYSGKYSLLRNMFDAEEYASAIKRWYYKGRPTRKHRRYLKMTRGMTEEQMHSAVLNMLNS